MTRQGDWQAGFRSAGGGSGSIMGDARAAFAAQADIPAGASFNGAFMAWLRQVTGSDAKTLNGLLAAWDETTFTAELVLEAVTTDFGTAGYDFEHAHTGNALLVVACTGEGLGQPACTLNGEAMTHVGGAANGDSDVDRVDFFLARPGASGTIALDKAGCATAISFSGFTGISAVASEAAFSTAADIDAGIAANEDQIVVCGCATDDNAAAITTGAMLTERQNQIVVAEPGDLAGAVATMAGEADGEVDPAFTLDPAHFWVFAAVVVS